MDPTACLRRIEDADTRNERRDACQDLQGWLSGGGFEPDWDAYPKGARIFRQWRSDKRATSYRAEHD